MSRKPRNEFRPTVTRLEDIRTNELRTIEPMHPCKPCTLPIMAIDGRRNTVLSEDTGAVNTFESYCEQLPHIGRHLVITYSSDVLLWQLHERWKNHPRWTWGVMVQNKPHHKQRQHVVYYGFRKPRKQAFTNIVIDASSFTDDEDPDLLAVGKWVREFCNTYGLRVRASAAGIGTQFLRHPMFYPFPRRAVPRFINKAARRRLPGPYYESYTDAAQRITAAAYIDQEAAYHYAAQTTPLPNSNSIRACGYTHKDGIYARAGGELYERELKKHGLIHAKVYVPWLPSDRRKFVPRTMQKQGYKFLWIWTNELPYLESMGLRIVHLVSVWGTEELDKGIAKYAQWAQNLGKQDPRLKNLLLTPYGALGRRPTTFEMHRQSRPGELADGNLLLAGQWVEGTHSREIHAQTLTANALQLGLIQAHVRALSLDMARQLAAKGQEVISIYADGIFVRNEGEQIPLFTPWRLKEDQLELHLTDSLRVPVRARVRRDYLTAKPTEGIALANGYDPTEE